MRLIDKNKLLEELKKLKQNLSASPIVVIEDVDSLVENLEVKEVDTWHLQEKEDIYDAIKDWGLYTFACIMKDGTIQKFSGILDEDCEGHIYVHIDGVNDDYNNVDDIIFWIETPNL